MVVKVMKANEIIKLDTTDITKKIDELKTELFNLRFQLATGQLENTARIKEVKKDIARMKTIIRQRELNK
jgi:large subunit ribosomal protein L29